MFVFIPLAGSIPSELRNLAALNYLDLDRNELSRESWLIDVFLSFSSSMSCAHAFDVWYGTLACSWAHMRSLRGKRYGHHPSIGQRTQVPPHGAERVSKSSHGPLEAYHRVPHTSRIRWSPFLLLHELVLKKRLLASSLVHGRCVTTDAVVN